MNSRPVFLWSKLSSAKWEDAWAERLSGVGLSGAVIAQFPDRPTIRVEVYTSTKAEAEAIQKEFGGSIREVKPADWMTTSVKRKPLHIRGELLVIDSEDEAEIERTKAANPRAAVLAIPSEMAFGTGEHPTTATCLRLLADVAKAKRKQKEPWDLLDLGCGSGILSFAGRMLGASSALGLDFDPAAVRIAKENAQRNGLDKIRFQKADALSWDAPRQWPVVLANLFSTVLIAAFPKILPACEDGATVILSGILHTQADEVLAAGTSHGLVFEKVLNRGKWVTAQATAVRT